MQKALAGPEPTARGYKATADEKAKRKKEREAEAKKRQKDSAAVEAALAKVKWPLTEMQMDIALSLAIKGASHDVLQGICKRRGIEAKKDPRHNGRDHRGAIGTAAREMKPRDRAALIFGLLIPSYSPHYNEGRASALQGL